MDLSIRSDLQYDDRAFGGDGDFALVLRPEIGVRDEEGQLQWGVRYRPFYEAFLDFSDASGLSHDLRLAGTWQPTRRTTIELTERYLDLSRARLFNERVLDEETGEATVESRTETSRIRNNSFVAELRHRLSAVGSFVLSVEHNLREEEERDLEVEGEDDVTLGGQERTNFGLTTRYLHSTSERTTLGLGLSATRSQVDRGGRSDAARGGDDENETDFVNLFGTWRYQPDESFEMRLSAGPTWVDSSASEVDLEPAPSRVLPLVGGENVDATSCPRTDGGRFYLSSECEGLGFRLDTLRVAVPPVGEVPEGSDGDISFFANGSVSKSWGPWESRLAYVRRESASGRFGSSTVVDLVTASLAWDPQERWRVELTGRWNRQTQATDRVVQVLLVQPIGPGALVPPETAVAAGVGATTVDNELESTVTSAALRVQYGLTRRVRLRGSAFYSRRGGDFARGRSDTDTARFRVGIEYDFDPIRF